MNCDKLCDCREGAPVEYTNIICRSSPGSWLLFSGTVGDYEIENPASNIFNPASKISNPAATIYNPASNMNNPSPVSPVNPPPPPEAVKVTNQLPVNTPKPQIKPTIPQQKYVYKTVQQYIKAAKKAFSTACPSPASSDGDTCLNSAFSGPQFINV